MAGESILIVEDAPETLKITAAALRLEGYSVSVSSTAEQALSALRFLQPDLILVDFMLPGMNGLDLSARIKQDPRQQKALVVALTAVNAAENEPMARQAGCDGFLAKPIETRVLLARIRNFLDRGRGIPAAAPPTPSPVRAPELPFHPGMSGLPQDQLVELQESFLKAGKGVSRQMLASVESHFDSAKATRTVHQWIGSAGLLGYSAISECAREAETVLNSAAVTADRVRGPLARLARTFYNPSGATSESASQLAAKALRGKRVALIGLGNAAADMMCGALEQVGARARLFDADQSPYDEAVGSCHLIVVHARPENITCRWIAKEAPSLPGLPTLFFGSAENLISFSAQAHERANGLLVDGCMLDEVMMRMRLAVTQGRAAPGGTVAAEGVDVVIAYGDTAMHPAIEARVREYGLTCRMASSSTEAILLLHTGRPRAAVVDVHLDAFEALAAIRAEAMPMRTILIAPQAQEDDILRGFSLGAEDYLVQPFSPLELVARLKWLLG
jgi:DNA-binding response OmpR family regulator